MPSPLESLVTKDEIACFSATEKLVLNDDIRISILESTCSIDVQACPGSGKTTLIAAKLILLAKKWPFHHQGVCVLSHTNVAKDEIISRLRRSEIIEAQRLLSYPHFVGTIQEFVNRFLALPYIRSNGIKDITVDNVEYTKLARWLLENHGRFAWLRGTLNGLGNVNTQDGFLRTTFRYFDQSEEKINIAKRPAAWNRNDNFQRAEHDLRLLKQYLEQQGFYLFRDMYTHAYKILFQNEGIRNALMNRFPCVFIDEMQDTQKFQDELLCEIFPLNEPGVIVQRFGDPDQAIFHGIEGEEANESFNSKSRDDMSFVIHKSHRFDRVLAEKIKSMSFNEIPLETEISAEVLVDRAGAHVAGGCFEHTVIVFNDETRENVVDFVSKIVSMQFNGQYKNSHRFLVKIVGAVGNEVDPNADQLKIGHYWAAYDKSKSNTSFKESSLIEAARYCRQSSAADWAEKYKFFIGCVLKLMRLCGKTDENGRYFSASGMRQELENNGRWSKFREGIYYLLNDRDAIRQEYWSLYCRLLELTLGLENIPDGAAEYLAFYEEDNQNRVGGERLGQEGNSVVPLLDNKIRHEDGFEIELSTIHGVKGETHDATVIVETKNQVFDLGAMLPYLTGDLPSEEHSNFQLRDKPHHRPAFKPNKVFMRQLYVAMSRPKHLLCLAIHSDRLDSDSKQKLEALGWKIEEIESV